MEQEKPYKKKYHPHHIFRQFQMPNQADHQFPLEDNNQSTIQQLSQEVQKLKMTLKNKTKSLKQLDKKANIENLKNGQKKLLVEELSKQLEKVKLSIVVAALEQNKNNKESPLFHNEIGLAPFELLLLKETRYQLGDHHLCMVCMMDLEMNTKILELPCHHFLHQDCAIQFLLASSICPACQQPVNLHEIKEKILRTTSKKVVWRP